MFGRKREPKEPRVCLFTSDGHYHETAYASIEAMDTAISKAMTATGGTGLVLLGVEPGTGYHGAEPYYVNVSEITSVFLTRKYQ